MENNRDMQQAALPKNIRQIGAFGETYKIYVEDFVYTYVHQFLHEKKEENTVIAAVLLGEIKKQDDREYVFISGAVKCDFRISDGEETRPEDEREDAEDKRQEFWGNVYQRIKEYFHDREILGWYINLDGSNLEINPWLQQFFESTYSRGSRFLYYEDSLERTDAFFVQEQHMLQRISGYAVYYERNPQMQEFMVAEKQRRKPMPEIPGDDGAQREDVAANYRALMNRIHEKQGKRRVQPIICVAGVAVLAVVVATGITQIGNYQNLRLLENTMQTLSGAVTGSPDAETSVSARENSEKQQDASAVETPDKPEEAPAQTTPDQEQSPSAEESGAAEGAQTAQEAEAAQETNAAQENQSGEGAQAQTEEQSPTEQKQDADPSSVPAAAETKPTYYTVKKGDSLVSISRRFYHSIQMVDEICSLNQIEDMDVIFEGQKLRLP